MCSVAHLEGDDQGVLACHEDGHVGDHLVVEDQHQPEHKERGVLLHSRQPMRAQLTATSIITYFS